MKKISLYLSLFAMLLLLTLAGSAAPTVTDQPENAPGTVGGAVTFTCKAKPEAEDGTLSYTWCWMNTVSGKRTAFAETKESDSPYITGNHTDTLTIKGLPASYVGLSISCYIKDESGAVWTNSVSITEGLVITKQPESASVKIGGTLSLECAANADDAVYTWCWYYEAGKSWPKLKNTEGEDSFKLKGADTAKLTIAGITEPYIGQTYACHISSESLGASLWTNPVTVSLTDDPHSDDDPDDGKQSDDPGDDKQTCDDEDDKDDSDKQSGTDEDDTDDNTSDIRVGDGEDAILRVDMTGDHYTYEWQFEREGYAESLGCTEDTLVIPADELGQYTDAVFYCIITDTITGDTFMTDEMILVTEGSSGGKDDKTETETDKDKESEKDEETAKDAETDKDEDKETEKPKDDGEKGENELPYTDVEKGIWYYDSVALAYKSGLINGMSDTEFAPTNNLTYAQAVKLAACLHQYYNDGEVTLAPAVTGLWYEPYMQYCIENGLLDKEQGEERLSRPDIIIDESKPISREAYAVLFADALPASALTEINEVPDGAIPDVAEENNFYGPAIYKFYRAGITIGRDALGTFDPHANITRAEISAILARLLDPEMRQEVSAEFGK